MSLPDGTSELDTVVLKIPDFGIEIKNWERYSVTQTFLKPTAEFSFTIGDGETDFTDILIDGTKIQIVINNKIQFTGFIEKIDTEISPDGGTKFIYSGRDTMAKVVTGGMDPALQFSVGLTLEKIVRKCLDSIPELGPYQLYYSDDINFNIITGTTRSPDPDEPEATKGQMKQLKPHYGEGIWAFLDRTFKRFGFMMWAAVDGSGFVIGKPNFTTNPTNSITSLKDSTNSTSNNVKHGRVTIDITDQPSVIAIKGTGNVEDGDYFTPNIVMVNELVGLDLNGIPTVGVQKIIDSYKLKKAKILPFRSELTPVRKIFYKNTTTAPLFLKDDEECGSLAELEKFCRREMAMRQQKIFSATYMVRGHTQNGIPWMVNTMVNVKDERNGLDEKLWVLERTFSKSSSEGTTTVVKLIKPYTLALS